MFMIENFFINDYVSRINFRVILNYLVCIKKIRDKMVRYWVYDNSKDIVPSYIDNSDTISNIINKENSSKSKRALEYKTKLNI